MPIPNVVDEAIFKEWDDRVVRATTIAASLDASQASGNITKTQSTTMSNDYLSQEIGSGDRPMCQEAIGSVISQTRSEKASKHSYDSPLPGGNTPGSDEDRPNINELMAICTNLSNRALALEKTARDLVIRKLKKKVRKLEKKLRAITPGMKLFKIGTSRRKSLDKENVSKQGRKSDKTKPMFDDSDFVELDMDNAMENTREEFEDNATNASNKLLQTAFEDKDRTIAQHFVKIESVEGPKHKRAEQIRNKPPTRAQLRNKMVTYLKHTGKYTHNQIKSKSFEEIQKLYEREQNVDQVTFDPIDSDVVKHIKRRYTTKESRIYVWIHPPSESRCRNEETNELYKYNITTKFREDLWIRGFFYDLMLLVQVCIATED
ncbi:hypothetical protein Tco_0932688 [Tanacetum coccineum]